MYEPGDYDVAGFCVGIVERKKIIDGSKIKAGDVAIGLASSGVHSNGYSLVRKVFSRQELACLSKELLKPTRIYVQPVLSLLEKNRVNGIAHITGGAFYDKIARILPVNLSVRIEKNSWVVPKIFQLIQNKGNISDREIYHTLNMGIGLVLVVKPKFAQKIITGLSRYKIDSWIIGEVVKGKKDVQIV
jgi:phosphoribosylformylglycinamidine cyclo-ligase